MIRYAMGFDIYNGEYSQIASEDKAFIDFCKGHERLYIFGAGKYGSMILLSLELNNIKPDGFIVSEPNERNYRGYKVYSVEDINITKKIGVILALKESFRLEVLEEYKDFFKQENVNYFKPSDTYLREYIKRYSVRLDELRTGIRRWEKEFVTAGESIAFDRIKNILVIQIENAIGDMIWGAPFIRELRKNFPQADIDYVVSKNMKDLVYACPYVNNIIYYNYDAQKAYYSEENEARIESFCKDKLSGKYYDISFNIKALPTHVYDAIDNVIIALYARAKYRVAHAFSVWDNEKLYFSMWKKLFTHIAINDTPEHDAIKDLSMLGFLGLKLTDDSLETWCNEAQIRKASKCFEKFAKNTLFIALGISGREPKRNWPAINYKKMADELHKIYGKKICFVLFGSKDNCAEANIINSTEAMVLNLVGQLSLGESCAAMKLCDMYVGADTSLLHMASAAQIPVVELVCNLPDGNDFDLGSPTRTGPWRVPFEVLQPPIGLDGCTHRCSKLYTHCISLIQVSDVVSAVIRMIDKIEGKQYGKNIGNNSGV